MNLRNQLLGATVGMIAASLSGQAFAAADIGTAFTGGIVNVIQDESVEVFLNDDASTTGGGAPTVTLGDRFVFLLRLTDINANGLSTAGTATAFNEATAVVVLEVSSTTPAAKTSGILTGSGSGGAGAGQNFAFSAPTGISVGAAGAGFVDPFNAALFDAGLLTAGDPGVANPGGTFAGVVFQDSTPDIADGSFSVLANTDPGGPVGAFAGVAGSALAAGDAGESAALLLALDPANGTEGDFVHTNAPADVSTLINANFNGRLSVISESIAGSIIPDPVLAAGGFATAPIISFAGALSPSPALPPPNFPLTDQTTFFALYVPEPASLGLMGAGLIGLGFALRRRRRASVA